MSLHTEFQLPYVFCVLRYLHSLNDTKPFKRDNIRKFYLLMSDEAVSAGANVHYTSKSGTEC